MATSLYSFHFYLHGFNRGGLNRCPQTFLVSATTEEDAKTHLISILREKDWSKVADFAGPYAPSITFKSQFYINPYFDLDVKTGKTALQTLIEMIEERGLVKVQADTIFFSALDS